MKLECQIKKSVEKKFFLAYRLLMQKPCQTLSAILAVAGRGLPFWQFPYRSGGCTAVHPSHPKGDTSSPLAMIAAYCSASAVLRSSLPGLPTLRIIVSSPPL